jgi:glyoxylase I family protein
VLDFQVVVADMDDKEWKRSVCLHPSGLMLSLTQHIISAPFDHRNAGIGHISFAVSKRSELDEWEQWLSEGGVRYSPISETDLGSVLSFRDPDDIPLEFYYLPS